MFSSFSQMIIGDVAKGEFNNQLDFIVRMAPRGSMSPDGDGGYVYSTLFEENSLYEIKTEVKEIIKLDNSVNCLF